MGEQRVSSPNEVDAQRFERSLLNDLEALDYMLQHGLIQDATRRIGAEQEMFLVDSSFRPAPVALEVLEKLNHPQFTTEMGKFNIEANLSPRILEGHCLRELEIELDQMISLARTAAREYGADILLSGTLPTAHQYHLSLDNLTPKPRYFELNRVMSKLRGPTYSVFIKGLDELKITHDNVMTEACCESFQVHFQVSPATFAPVYNLAQLVTAPLLASAVNSPLLLGQRLWAETRIALFQHSVDERSRSHLVRGAPARVNFGECWLDHSVIEIFREEIARFRVIMTTEVQEDAWQVLAQGGIPNLEALRLHNGTCWRWNRPCYGITEGQPHLRIELRALPAGPSVIDEVANAAFAFGMLVGLAPEYSDLANRFPFEETKQNFFVAARHGLNAQFTWPGCGRVTATELILKELLPVARTGLRSAGIVTEDIDRYLGTIEERVRRERTGSQWALQSLAAMRDRCSREACHRCLTAAMVENQKSGLPVHLWPLAELPAPPEPMSLEETVEDNMSTDLFTVRGDDLVRLAANMMDWRNICHVPVEDDEGRLIGLVTHRQMIRLLARKTPENAQRTFLVRDIMQLDPPTVAPELPIADAIEKMRKLGTDCFPVVVGQRLVGILTLGDLVRLASRYFGAPAAPQRAVAVAAAAAATPFDGQLLA
jgi:CBS domain-containing protein/gamma-glutamyl:cysteine ligase YbdK (ATP-grasp superfamily)